MSKGFTREELLAEREKRASDAFDEAKRLSDFAGMVTRTIFAVFVLLYFVNGLFIESWLWKIPFALGAMATVVLAMEMVRNLAAVIYTHAVVSAFRIKDKSLSVAAITLVGIATFAIGLGLSRLIMDGAQVMLVK
ncbi:hypothetical protein [Mesorhizobium sp. M0323]|uniref:hypothetical protein n=1 Tax=Mesorhizobium sp. M0323 TaxID=2956938 RepID=UPI00333C5330